MMRLTAILTTRSMALGLVCIAFPVLSADPKGTLSPLRVQNVCGAREPGAHAPDTPDDNVGRVVIRSVLTESGQAPVLIDLDCVYHWTDGALGLPSWLYYRDNGFRPGTWSCKFEAAILQTGRSYSPSDMPTKTVERTTLNQPQLEGWHGSFEMRLADRQFTLSSANNGLGIDVGGFPGNLTLLCPAAIKNWSSPSEAIGALFAKKPLASMKDCKIRVVNSPTGRTKTGLCDGFVTIPGYWVEESPRTPAEPPVK